MPDLRDKSVWLELLGPMEVARQQLLDRAARCDAVDHDEARGKLMGLEHALMLFSEARKRLLKASGDPLPD